MPWRKFINSTNPVAAALMAKMKIEVADRPLVKLQCLRLILSLQIDESKMRLIAGFVETYLVLTAEENRALRRPKMHHQFPHGGQSNIGQNFRFQLFLSSDIYASVAAKL